MDHGERRSGSAHEAALWAVQRPAAKPWRGGLGGSAGAMAPAPALPKVYRVAPRDFRDLVQRLTGAGTAPPVAMGARHSAPVEPAPAYAAVGLRGESDDAAAEMFDYVSWFSVPLLSPASMPLPAAGYDGQLHGNGALL
ncbi:hypothetical protein E2562_001215 [Oryza meyeriana var. granulata]|uniref:VQ domain-containing protein n=1 Tax=Oryza meyeriana var. granulata TaxID=110450 RepID=A0A6G1DCF3_9ORYZ|nr:hypothetical protein E2562_001215 [Oryza meyeriana var. granulata]